jgi:gamma-glutamyltranspeptidase/glutathione hydrolase
MAPAIVTSNGHAVASIGSSGGRKIMNCNAQIIANLAVWNMPIGEALAAPRIDASTHALQASDRLDQSVREGLAALGHDVVTVDETLGIGTFASPVALGLDADGTIEAAADAWYYPATAIALP